MRRRRGPARMLRVRRSSFRSPRRCRTGRLRLGKHMLTYRRLTRRPHRVLFSLLTLVVAGALTAAALAGFLLVGLAVTGVLVLVRLAFALRLGRLQPFGPSGGGPASPGGASVREPRRPRPQSPAGAAMLPLPDEDDPPRRAVALA
jgi:hypothetical protein